MKAIGAHLDKQRARHLTQLQELLRIPSISTDSARAADVKRAAEWVHRRLLAAGCTSAEVYKTARHPVVYGEWLGAPGQPTILVYGHYDVQPVDPLNLWKIPPFEPTIKNGRIHARGASDDKGQFIIHINALEAHLAVNGTCPVNVKFLIEGEEEIGSPNLEGFLRKHRKRLACDAVVVSDTAMFAKGLPSICYGLRGLTYFELRLRGTDRDLHSGTYGGAVANPAAVLVRLLASLKDERGHVTIPGFYDDVKSLTRQERSGFAKLPHSDAAFRRSIAAPALEGEAGYTTLERIWARPTLEINGIWGGFTGEGAKTVIPAEARAKVSMRLVPHQSSTDIGLKFARHMKRIVPKSVDLDVIELHGGEAWLAPIDHEALRAASRALERAFSRKPVFVREGGSIPVVATFERLLRVPTVLMGIGLNEDNLHAPNEKLDVDNFHGGVRASAFFMEEFGATVSARPTKTRAAQRSKKQATRRR